jgi:hypothetical protein
MLQNHYTMYSGTCLIWHTNGPGKCVRLYRMSEYSGFILVNRNTLGPSIFVGCYRMLENSDVGLHKFHCNYISRVSSSGNYFSRLSPLQPILIFKSPSHKSSAVSFQQIVFKSFLQCTIWQSLDSKGLIPPLDFNCKHVKLVQFQSVFSTAEKQKMIHRMNLLKDAICQLVLNLWVLHVYID